MSPTLGQHLRIRSMAYLAGEPVPFFWPMRSFIHHNPLHGLEHLPFAEALKKGAKLFHGRAFLPRTLYQGYLADDSIDAKSLDLQLEKYSSDQTVPQGINLADWGKELLVNFSKPITQSHSLVSAEAVHNALHGHKVEANSEQSVEQTAPQLSTNLLKGRPLYDSIDALYGKSIGEEINDYVVRSCLDYFDEGQSVWVMPDRELGFFKAWTHVAGGQVKSLLKKITAAQSTDDDQLIPEQVIEYVMQEMEVPEEHWVTYFTCEIAQLHGWSGFIRWRACSSHYHWAEKYPGDLVDLLAIRLAIGLILIKQRAGWGKPKTYTALEKLVTERPQETYLRLELYSGKLLPKLTPQVDNAISIGRKKLIERTFDKYLQVKVVEEAKALASNLRELSRLSNQTATLEALSQDDLATLITALQNLEAGEGMIWLQAMENKALELLIDGISLEPPKPREKRPFAQAAFCIDTRSERIRRHLESAGDYQTYGIAGFFGVPVSLMELGQGNEMHLCPVLLTPKNLVLEMSSAIKIDEKAITTLDHALHKLKESIISPFVTVEAIGLLFGFDMIGKTVAPANYNSWRKHLHTRKPSTHLLHDKLTREQGDSIVRAVQRAVIEEALAVELGLEHQDIYDHMVRQLREAALGNSEITQELATSLKVDLERLQEFVDRLTHVYRINPSFTQVQLEQLGRIGYSLDEQAGYVWQALSSIGLTDGFSRFVLLVGHGSTSENNPYESALDCGACGGNHGLVNARILAQMANKSCVRKRLEEKGLSIPDDTWFVPSFHDTTTDEISLHDLELLPTSHLVYLDRLRNGLTSAARLCAQERMPTLSESPDMEFGPTAAAFAATRNSSDWSQVRPEWGLARNAYFIIGRRALTESFELDGRAFLHSYDYQVDPKLRLLENILTGPLVVGQWINMEHYFSAVDNERFGSGSKVYHNVAGRFGVMTGNLSDLRTGLPSQTVLKDGLPHHEPIRLTTVIEAPLKSAKAAINSVPSAKRLVNNGWVKMVVVDPETAQIHLFDEGEWVLKPSAQTPNQELAAS